MPRNGRRTITENTDLGIGMLIAEAKDGTYQRVAAVVSISEGREIAVSVIRRRMQPAGTRQRPHLPGPEKARLIKQ